MTGKMKYLLANASLGAIITHAIVNEAGTHIVAAECGEILYWCLETREVVYRDKQENVIQVIMKVKH